MSAEAWAHYYLSRGWVPLPVHYLDKRPVRREWQTRTLESAVAELTSDFSGTVAQNIGILLGAPSGKLVDVDLDCPEALAFADHFLPPTLTFGRPSNPRSHRLFLCALDSKPFKAPDGKMLVELRSTGQQTVFPGSVHTTGEHISFEDVSEAPRRVDAVDLCRRVRIVAAGALLARSWPSAGRHDAQLALAGTLLQAGFGESDALAFLCLVCSAAGNEDAGKRAETIRSTAARLAANEVVTGLGSLKSVLPFGVGRALEEWFDVERRPTIRISSELHSLVDQGVRALGADANLYQRDGRLVQVIKLDGDLDANVGWTRGAPAIVTITEATLRERLTRVARWERFDRRSKDWVSVIPPDHVVRAVLARGEWEGIRPLVGVIETPSFRPDGTAIEVAGYDAPTGYLFEPSAEVPPVKIEPTQQDAALALMELFEVFQDFPYRDPASICVAIACLLTLVARPMIEGSIPAILFDASVRGSGKTLQVDAISLIATGRVASRMNWPTSDEELEKVLGAYAVRGARLINFDNVARPFGGAALDKCLTATDRVELRVLGKSEVLDLHWRALVVASGNNLQVFGDTSRRVLISRIEPNCEHPEDRDSFTHADLLGWIRTERPRLVRAAMTMIAAWVAAGRTRLVQKWGSFDNWAAIVGSSIVFAGGVDVVSCRAAREEGHDPEATALDLILSALERVGRGITLREFIPLLHTQGPIGLEVLDACTTLARTKPTEQLDVKALGIALRRFLGRVIGGRKLATGTNNGRKVNVWRCERA